MNILNASREWAIACLGGIRMYIGSHWVPLPLESGLLGLHGWNELERLETEDSYTITAEYPQPVICPVCQSKNSVRFGVREQEYLDLPVHMKKVKIVVRRQRHRCKDCDYTYLLPIGNMHEDRFMTKRLVAYIQNAALKETFTSIAELIGTSESTIRDVFREYCAVLEHDHELETPEWLGIDEVYLGKQMRCIFTNVRGRHPIEMLPVRDKVTVEAFLRKLETQKIEGVCMDMWNPYKQAVKAVLPHAIIVVDKFHIVRMANIAMEKIRKKTREDMPARWRVKLKNDRKILLKRNETLTVGQKFILDTWLLNYEGLGKAYAAKEAFINIWNSGDRVEAEYLYSKWKDSLDEEIVPAFAELTRAMENWHDEIFTYFDYRYTNAYTESANAIIKQVQHAGRGYSFDVIRAKILFGLKPKEEKTYLTDEDFV